MSRWVLDQNYFRDPDLQARLVAATADDAFVMTDYAFVEMFKAPQWELTARLSLGAISAHPDKIVVCRAPSHMLRAELANRTATGGWPDIVDNELTQRTRLYLHELATVGQNGPRHAIVQSMIASAQASLATQQQDHTTNLRLLQNGARAWQRVLRAPVLADLRAGRMPDETRVLLAIEIASGAARSMLLEHGATETQADDFLAGDSFLLRSQISFTLLSIAWVEQGGADNLRADRATNEIMDIDYALFGSYCDGVLTREPRVTRHHGLLALSVPMIQREVIADPGTN